MDRRNFITSSLKLGGWTLAGSMIHPFLLQKAMAQATTPENFLLIRVHGGWDTSLCMDPWTQDALPDPTDYFVEYRKSDLISSNGALYGPGMSSIKKYLNSMTVINGLLVNVSEPGHDSAGLYVASGNGQGKLGEMNVEIDKKLKNSVFGIFANSTIQVGTEKPMIVNTRSFQRMTPQKFWITPDAQSTDLMNDKLQLNNNQDMIAAFNTKLDQILSSRPSGGPLTDQEIMAAAFASGVSHSGYISLDGLNLDTHTSHPKNHLSALTSTFEKISQILDVMASTSNGNGTSVLDSTTVYITSEFTRTPALNTSQGKDHNPKSNSVIVISPHMKPGVIGAAHLVDRKTSPSGTPFLAATPLDTVTFQPVNTLENAFILRPESVVATLFKTLGVDPGSVAPSLGKAPILTSILK